MPEIDLPVPENTRIGAYEHLEKETGSHQADAAYVELLRVCLYDIDEVPNRFDLAVRPGTHAEFAHCSFESRVPDIELQC